MRRLTGSVVFALSLALIGAGCDSSSTNTPTTPTVPTLPTTESFTGSIAPGGAVTFSFIAISAGYVQATLSKLDPETQTEVELALGTWNGSSCALSITNPTATQGITVTGYANSAATLCVRMADAKATLTRSNAFEITVIHP
jgi:hypothetical protein